MSQTAPIPRGVPTERDTGPFHPNSALTRLRRVRPLSPLVFPDGHEGWLATGYDVVRQLGADTRFSSRTDLDITHLPYEAPGFDELTEPLPVQPGMFVNMDPPEHTRLRGMLTGTFTVKRMKLLEAHIVDVVERQVDALLDMTPPVDLVTAFALPVPSLVICEILGVPYEERAEFQTHSANSMTVDIPFDERMAAYAGMTTYLYELVKRKRAAPGDDVLSDLARHNDVSDEELTGIAHLLLGAGHETTANMLALGTFALLEHPDQLADLRANPELMPGAVEELMRFLSIADFGIRYATEDLQLADETIRRGTTVAMSILTANRDPERFDDPDTLNIRRNARGHLAFGHGVHQCLGQQLSRIELRAGYDALLRRIPSLALAVGAGEVRLRTDMQIYGVHELPVGWDTVVR